MHRLHDFIGWFFSGICDACFYFWKQITVFDNLGIVDFFSIEMEGVTSSCKNVSLFQITTTESWGPAREVECGHHGTTGTTQAVQGTGKSEASTNHEALAWMIVKPLPLLSKHDCLLESYRTKTVVMSSQSIPTSVSSVRTTTRETEDATTTRSDIAAHQKVGTYLLDFV